MPSMQQLFFSFRSSDCNLAGNYTIHNTCHKALSQASTISFTDEAEPQQNGQPCSHNSAVIEVACTQRAPRLCTDGIVTTQNCTNIRVHFQTVRFTCLQRATSAALTKTSKRVQKHAVFTGSYRRNPDNSVVLKTKR